MTQNKHLQNYYKMFDFCCGVRKNGLEFMAVGVVALCDITITTLWNIERTLKSGMKFTERPISTFKINFNFKLMCCGPLSVANDVGIMEIVKTIANKRHQDECVTVHRKKTQFLSFFYSIFLACKTNISAIPIQTVTFKQLCHMWFCFGSQALSVSSLPWGLGDRVLVLIKGSSSDVTGPPSTMSVRASCFFPRTVWVRRTPDEHRRESRFLCCPFRPFILSGNISITTDKGSWLWRRSVKFYGLICADD